MSEKKYENHLEKRGFWYEKLPTGETAVCFRVRVHGQTFIQKLKLPPKVEKLTPVSV